MGNSKNANPLNSRNDLTMLTADVAVRFFDNDAFITLNCPKKKGLWPRILLVMEENDLEILNATLSKAADNDFHCIHAKVPIGSILRSDVLQSMLEDLIVEELGIQPCNF